MQRPLFLGIEIGGTKLQLGVAAAGESEFVEILRTNVDATRAAAGIRENIVEQTEMLIERHKPAAIGIGFGGPVDRQTGVTTTSHQVDGWDNFPITDWLSDITNLPVSVANDCDAAALAEALLGAGRGSRIVLYVTVGTGIGGGLVIDSQIHGAARPSATEIGHMRPGLDATSPHATVEARSSGRGIETVARERLFEALPAERNELLKRCGGQAETLTAVAVGEAAADGNAFADEVISGAVRTLGWAIAQSVTLLAPNVVVVGGGVSLLGEERFFVPLREAVADYVFGPLRNSFTIVPAALGEETVVHGACLIAAHQA